MTTPFAEAKAAAVARFERAYVEAVMADAGGNVSKAARLAGLDRGNFRRLVKRAQGRLAVETAGELPERFLREAGEVPHV